MGNCSDTSIGFSWPCPLTVEWSGEVEICRYPNVNGLRKFSVFVYFRITFLIKISLYVRISIYPKLKLNGHGYRKTVGLVGLSEQLPSCALRDFYANFPKEEDTLH